VSWIKHGLNGAGVINSGTSVSANLSLPPAPWSIVFCTVAYTGPGSAWNYPTDNFGDGGPSWNNIAAQGSTDQFGNQIGFLVFWRSISFIGATGTTVTAHNTGTACGMGMNLSCWKPNVSVASVQNTGWGGHSYNRQGSGTATNPQAFPDSLMTPHTNGISMSGVWDDTTIASAPLDPAWTLQAAAASSTPQVGAIQMSVSSGNGTGSGTCAWANTKPHWLLQASTWFYDLIPPPVILSDPVIIGTPTVGVPGTFTQSTANSGSITLTQWTIDGNSAPGGTDVLTYTPVPTDAGKQLGLYQFWTNDGGTTITYAIPKTVIGISGGWFNYLQSQGVV